MSFQMVKEVLAIILGSPTALLGGVVFGIWVSRFVIKKSDFEAHVIEDARRFQSLDTAQTEIKEGVAYIKGKLAKGRSK